jgi:hypothetical protein
LASIARRLSFLSISAKFIHRVRPEHHSGKATTISHVPVRLNVRAFSTKPKKARVLIDNPIKPIENPPMLQTYKARIHRRRLLPLDNFSRFSLS